MSSNPCVVCSAKKAHLLCDVCKSTVCKDCAVFLEESEFAFWEGRPDILKKATFCPYCYNKDVLPAIESFEEIYQRAKQMDIYTDKQTKETRLMSRKEKPIKVINGRDAETCLMRLAFLAAEKGFDTLIDVTTTQEKVRENNYQRSNWSIRGIPLKRN